MGDYDRDVAIGLRVVKVVCFHDCYTPLHLRRFQIVHRWFITRFVFALVTHSCFAICTVLIRFNLVNNFSSGFLQFLVLRKEMPF